MYSRIYGSAIIHQAVIYILVSLILGLLFIFSPGTGSSLLLLPLINIAVYVMVGCGPLVFASAQGLEMRTMLPSSSAEKAVFAVAYTFVAVPLMAVVPVYTCYLAGYDYISEARADMPAFLSMIDTYFSSSSVYVAVSLAFMAAVCLAVVTGRRRYRTLLSLLALFGAAMLLWISNVAHMAVTFKAMYGNRIVAYYTDSNQTLFNDIARLFSYHGGMASYYAVWESAILLFLTLMFIVISIRNINKRQL